MTDFELIGTAIAFVGAAATAGTAIWQWKQGKSPAPQGASASAQRGATAIAVNGAIHAPIVGTVNLSRAKDPRLARLKRLRKAADMLEGQMTCGLELRDEAKVGEALAALEDNMLRETEFPDSIYLCQRVKQVQKETKTVETAVAERRVLPKGMALPAVRVLADGAEAYFAQKSL